jgi:hypothetical protein
MEIYRRFTPQTGEFGSFYSNYLKNVKNLSIGEALAEDEKMWNNLMSIKGLDIQKTYQQGKWTIAELLLHCVDTERVFAGRLIRLLRKDPTPMPGFDQDVYVSHSFPEKATMKSIYDQWLAARAFTVSMLKSAEESSMEFIGEASGYPISARALALIIPGHNLHHYKILKERYGLVI